LDGGRHLVSQLQPDPLFHERLTYRYAGRDFRLTDVHGHVVRELIA